MQTLTLTLESLSTAGLEMHYENGEIVIRNARIVDFKPNHGLKPVQHPSAVPYYSVPGSEMFSSPLPHPMPSMSPMPPTPPSWGMNQFSPVETKLFNLMSNQVQLSLFLDGVLRGDTWCRLDKDNWWHSPEPKGDATLCIDPMHVPMRYKVFKNDGSFKPSSPCALVYVLNNVVNAMQIMSSFNTGMRKPLNCICVLYAYIDPSYPKCLSICILQDSYDSKQRHPYRFIEQAMSRVTGHISTVSDAYMSVTAMLTQLDDEVSIDLLERILKEACKVSSTEVVSIDVMLTVNTKMTIEVYDSCVKIFKPTPEYGDLVTPHHYGDPAKVAADEIPMKVFYVHIMEANQTLVAKLTETTGIGY